MKNIFPDGLIGIIYDCDGVMVDSEDANRHFYNSVLAAFDLPPMTPEQERYAFMATSLDALKRIVPEARWGEIIQKCRDAVDYNREILPRTRLMPGYREFVEKAHAAGLRQAIDTNRTAEGIQRILDFFHLPYYFDPVISCSVAEPKPAPQGVQMVCEKWHALPGQVLFIGDSIDDLEAAKNAGAVFGGFGGHVKGDIHIADFASLEHLLLKPANATSVGKGQ